MLSVECIWKLKGPLLSRLRKNPLMLVPSIATTVWFPVSAVNLAQAQAENADAVLVAAAPRSA